MCPVASWSLEAEPWNMRRVDVTRASALQGCTNRLGHRRRCRFRCRAARRVSHVGVERRGRRCPRWDRSPRVRHLFRGLPHVVAPSPDRGCRGGGPGGPRLAARGDRLALRARSPSSFISWRVPWSVVESFAVEGPPGRASERRCADGGAGRWVHPIRGSWARSPRRAGLPRGRGRGATPPGSALVAISVPTGRSCCSSWAGLLSWWRVPSRTSAAWSTGTWPVVPSTTAKELRDLESQIAIGDGFAVALYVWSPWPVSPRSSGLGEAAASPRPGRGRPG